MPFQNPLVFLRMTHFCCRTCFLLILFFFLTHATKPMNQTFIFGPPMFFSTEKAEGFFQSIKNSVGSTHEGSQAQLRPAPTFKWRQPLWFLRGPTPAATPAVACRRWAVAELVLSLWLMIVQISWPGVDSEVSTTSIHLLNVD